MCRNRVKGCWGEAGERLGPRRERSPLLLRNHFEVAYPQSPGAHEHQDPRSQEAVRVTTTQRRQQADSG